MNAIATATETATVVRIGKGLTFHAQLRGVDAPAAACGTVSRSFGAERHVQGTVSCRKCLDAIEAEADREEAFAAQQAREESIVAEEAPVELTQAERSAAVGEWITGTIEAIRASTPTDAIVKGDVVTLIADGQGWTVRRVLKDGTLRLINEDGKKINRKASAVTK